MKRRGFFGALAAACATPIVAKAVPRNVEEDVRKAMEEAWEASPPAPRPVWAMYQGVDHNHCVTYPGHSHSFGSCQRDPTHAHHVHYGLQPQWHTPGPHVGQLGMFLHMQAIPAGWVVCDGRNGTPDLRGHF